MYRLKGNRPRPKGPLNIVISEYPKQVDDAEDAVLGDQLLSALEKLSPSERLSFWRSLNKDEMGHVIDEILDIGTIDEKPAWNTFIFRKGFTHFGTLTLGGKFNMKLAYRLLDQFIKDYYQELLGPHWYSSDNKKRQPLIFAFADKGSDKKTSAKLRRQSQGLLSGNRTIKFSKDNKLHFHLLIKCSDKIPLEKVQEAIKAAPAIWKNLNKVFSIKSCAEAKIEPIADKKKVILYSLKNFPDLPLGRVTPSQSLGAPATQLTLPI
ncbi:MAG: hypothetical protein Q7U39_16455 [Nitrospira sp.]|nr:hypothetical protein [Nitrospira sp.]